MQGNEARDLITENNVTRTWTENKQVCFRLKNGMKIKLDPNQMRVKSKAMEKALQ